MKRSTIFWKAFLDGFTMAGFLNTLRAPGSPTVLFTPEDSELEWPPVTFEPAPSSANAIEIAGNLKSVPRAALRVMIDVLKREDESRGDSAQPLERADYAHSR